MKDLKKTWPGMNEIMGRNKRKFKRIIGLLQLMIMWYKISKIMLEGKLIIIPALGHQNKGKSNHWFRSLCFNVPVGE